MQEARLAAACKFALPPQSAGVNLEYLEVLYGPAQSPLAKVNDLAGCSSGSDGWYFDPPTNPKRIVTCPSTCNQSKNSVSSAPEDNFQIRIKCPPP
jgi:hypothetical protein